MRRGAISAVCAAAISLAAAAPAWAGPEAGLTSDNVTHVRNIPKHIDSSGGRLLGKYFYITTGRDLTIYDVSTPENPVEVGALRFPKAEKPVFPEEDVDTNGRILLVENGNTLFVIDVTDKTAPKVMGEVNDAGTHTITWCSTAPTPTATTARSSTSGIPLSRCSRPGVGRRSFPSSRPTT